MGMMRRETESGWRDPRIFHLFTSLHHVVISKMETSVARNVLAFYAAVAGQSAALTGFGIRGAHPVPSASSVSAKSRPADGTNALADRQSMITRSSIIGKSTPNLDLHQISLVPASPPAPSHATLRVAEVPRRAVNRRKWE